MKLNSILVGNNINLILTILIIVIIACNCTPPDNNRQTNTYQKNENTTPTPQPTFADLKTRADRLLATKQDDYETVELKEFDDVMQPLREIPKESKDFKEAQALDKKLIDKASVIGAERIVLGKKPMQSEWDGDVLPVKQYLREVLNDYDSSEFVEWSPVSKVYIGKEPYWGVRLKLRAKNAFGAYVLRDTYYFIRNEKVVKSEGLGAN